MSETFASTYLSLQPDAPPAQVMREVGEREEREGDVDLEVRRRKDRKERRRRLGGRVVWRWWWWWW